MMRENSIVDSSTRDKRKDVEFIEKMFNNEKSYGNIANFAIVTLQDSGSDMKSPNGLRNRLKSYGYKYVVVEGDGELGVDENTILIFNIGLDVLKYDCAGCEQPSFVFCFPENGEIICQYWEKEDPQLPFKKKSYVLTETSSNWESAADNKDHFTITGRKFKFTIDLKYLDEVNGSLEYYLSLYHKKFPNASSTNQQIIEFTIMGVGLSPYLYRKSLNR